MAQERSWSDKRLGMLRVRILSFDLINLPVGEGDGCYAVSYAALSLITTKPYLMIRQDVIVEGCSKSRRRNPCSVGSRSCTIPRAYFDRKSPNLWPRHHSRPRGSDLSSTQVHFSLVTQCLTIASSSRQIRLPSQLLLCLLWVPVSLRW